MEEKLCKKRRRREEEPTRGTLQLSETLKAYVSRCVEQEVRLMESRGDRPMHADKSEVPLLYMTRKEENETLKAYVSRCVEQEVRSMEIRGDRLMDADRSEVPLLHMTRKEEDCADTLHISDFKKVYVSRWVKEQARLMELRGNSVVDTGRNDLDLLQMMRKEENEEETECTDTLQLSDFKRAYVSRWVEEQARLMEIQEDRLVNIDRNERDLLHIMRKAEIEEETECTDTFQLRDFKRAYVSRWVEEQARLMEVHKDRLLNRSGLHFLHMMRKEENCRRHYSTKEYDGRDGQVDRELQQDINRHEGKLLSQKRACLQSDGDKESLPCKNIHHHMKSTSKDDHVNVILYHHQKEQINKSKEALYKQMFLDQEELRKDRATKAIELETAKSSNFIFFHDYDYDHACLSFYLLCFLIRSCLLLTGNRKLLTCNRKLLTCNRK